MDQLNPFETTTTFKLHRAEYLLGLAITTVLLAIHFTELNWAVAIGLFLYIDVIGYFPGAIAFHRSVDKRIHRGYYVLYNTMHSLITQTIVVGAWGLIFGWQWALLVVPFHLFGDRGLFGNFLKPFSVSFEPATHPVFASVRDSLEQFPTGSYPTEQHPSEHQPPSTGSLPVESVPVGVGDAGAVSREAYR